MKNLYNYLFIILGFFSFSAFGQSVTLTSETIPAATVYPGENAIIYSFKLTGNSGATSWQTMSFNTSGTYTSADVSSYSLYVSSANDFSTATTNPTINNTAATPVGAGDFITFTNPFTTFFGNPINASSQYYFFIVATLKPGATAGRTLKVNGVVNPVLMTFNTSTTPVNNQTDATGLQTIGTRSLTLSSESVPAGLIYPSNSTLLYTLKVSANAGTHALQSVNVPYSGTILSSEIESISIFQNTVNDAATATQMIYFNSTPSFTGGTFSFIFNSAFRPSIPIGASKYFFIYVKLKGIATVGSTIKVNGSTGPATVVPTILPTVQTNLQTDAAGLKTVAAPSVSQFTELLPPINVYKNEKVAIYKIRVEPGATFPTLNTLSVVTSGSYLSTDISSFELRYGNSSLPTTLLTSTVSTPAGAGETISFTGINYLLPSATPTYLYIMANIKNTATSGRIIKVNGALNPAMLTYSAPTTSIINSQSDLAGSRIIVSSNIFYVAQAVPASNIFKGSTRNVVYKAKISNLDPAINLNSISFVTSGTYLAGDFTNFRLTITNSDNRDLINMLSFYNLNVTPTNNGETLTFTNTLGSTFANNSVISGDKYLWITADVSPTSTNGRTIKINALTNPATLTFFETPNRTNTLADIAGIQTIGDMPLTLSTVSTPAANIYQGDFGNPMYILKVDASSEIVKINSMKINATGTFTGYTWNGPDFRGFLLYYNSVNDLSTATFVEGNWKNQPFYGPSSNELNFTPFLAPVTIPAGQSGYFYLIPIVSNTGVAGHTIKVDGSANPIALVFLDGAIGTITNNQTNIAGLQTILANTVTSTPVVSASSTTFCSGNSPSGVTLTSTGCPDPSQATWFVGGSSVAFTSTNGSIVVAPTSPTTYTVVCDGTGYTSAVSNAVTITPVLINQPTSLTASPLTSPSAGTPITLTANGCAPHSVVWDDLSTANPRIVSPSASTTYSFQCFNSPCTSSTQSSFSLTVGPCPMTLALASTADDVGSGTLLKIASANPGGSILATNIVNGTADVTYTARSITLQPGFLAQTNKAFLAIPGGCN